MMEVFDMRKENPKKDISFDHILQKNGKRIYPKNSKVFKIPVE